MTLERVRSQRGAGAIGCLLLMVAIGFGVYAGFQYAMPKLRHNSFSDRLNESMYHLKRQPEDFVHSEVLRMAKEFDIVLTPEQLHVSSTSHSLEIDVKYEKVLDLKVWQTTLPFELHRSVRY